MKIFMRGLYLLTDSEGKQFLLSPAKQMYQGLNFRDPLVKMQLQAIVDARAGKLEGPLPEDKKPEKKKPEKSKPKKEAKIVRGSDSETKDA